MYLEISFTGKLPLKMGSGMFCYYSSSVNRYFFNILVTLPHWYPVVQNLNATELNRLVDIHFKILYSKLHLVHVKMYRWGFKPVQLVHQGQINNWIVSQNWPIFVWSVFWWPGTLNCIHKKLNPILCVYYIEFNTAISQTGLQILLPLKY